VAIGRKLRCGVIGTGNFADVCHIPELQAHPQAEVVAIAGGRSRAQALANKYGIADVHEDYRELCARDDIDAVTIVTRTVDHRSQALAAFDRGKHVFCEKPLGLDLHQAREMTRAAHASGRVHHVGFVFRYNFGVRELRRRVVNGDIGQPFLLRVQYDNWTGLTRDWRAGWVDQRALAGAGMLFHLGSHLFDLAAYVLGPIESAIGFTHLVPRTRPDATGTSIAVETDDLFGAWLRLANGAHGQIFGSRATPSFTQNGHLEVIGSHGALKAALSRGAFDVLNCSCPDAPEWSDVPLPAEAADKRPHSLGFMMRGFVDACLRGASDPDVDGTFDAGLAAQHAMAAMLESETQRRWIDLSEV
jgi:predicted dehydrogenase